MPPGGCIFLGGRRPDGRQHITSNRSDSAVIDLSVPEAHSVGPAVQPFIVFLVEVRDPSTHRASLNGPASSVDRIRADGPNVGAYRAPLRRVLIVRLLDQGQVPTAVTWVWSRRWNHDRSP